MLDGVVHRLARDQEQLVRREAVEARQRLRTLEPAVDAMVASRPFGQLVEGVDEAVGVDLDRRQPLHDGAQLRLGRVDAALELVDQVGRRLVRLGAAFQRAGQQAVRGQLLPERIVQIAAELLALLVDHHRHLALEPRPVADVRPDAGGADDAARTVVHGGGRPCHVHRLPVLVPHHQIAVVHRLCGIGAATELATLAGHRQHGDVAAADLFGTVAEQALGTGIPVDDPAVGGPGQHGGARRAHQRDQPRLSLGRTLALGDVGQIGDGADDRAAFVAQREGPHQHDDVAVARAAAQHQLGVVHLLAAQGAPGRQRVERERRDAVRGMGADRFAPAVGAGFAR